MRVKNRRRAAGMIEDAGAQVGGLLARTPGEAQCDARRTNRITRRLAETGRGSAQSGKSAGVVGRATRRDQSRRVEQHGTRLAVLTYDQRPAHIRQRSVASAWVQTAGAYGFGLHRGRQRVYLARNQNRRGDAWRRRELDCPLPCPCSKLSAQGEVAEWSNASVSKCYFDRFRDNSKKHANP